MREEIDNKKDNDNPYNSLSEYTSLTASSFDYDYQDCDKGRSQKIKMEI